MVPDFWKKYDLTTRALILLPALLAGVVIYDQWYLWSTKEDYQFGYAVPFFSAYVIYDRWPKILAYLQGEASPAETPAPKFLELLFGAGALFSLLAFAGGGLTRVIGGPSILGTIFNTCGFCGVWLGCVWMISEKDLAGTPRGWRERLGFASLFTFPILIWVVSGPFLYLVDSQIKYLLLEKVTLIDVKILNAFDYKITNDGNVFVLPGGGHVSMEDACSGIRSFSLCVFMSSFIGAVFIESKWKKLLMIALAIPTAIVANILRTSFLTLWAYDHGPESIDCDFAGNGPKSPNFSLGTVHDIAGHIEYAIIFLILIAIYFSLTFKLKAPEAPPPEAPPAA